MRTTGIIPMEVIEQKIFLIRDQKVMLSTHLAHLYNVEVRALVQAVKRNFDRFPKDFMFQLTRIEFQNLKSQIVTSRWGGARRSLPYAFTEQGLAMLSTVLKSKKAVKVNIQIMRAFVKLREIVFTHKELAQRLRELELKIDSHDQQIQAVFEVINQLLEPTEKPKKKIGF